MPAAFHAQIPVDGADTQAGLAAIINSLPTYAHTFSNGCNFNDGLPRPQTRDNGSRCQRSTQSALPNDATLCTTSSQANYHRICWCTSAPPPSPPPPSPPPPPPPSSPPVSFSGEEFHADQPDSSITSYAVTGAPPPPLYCSRAPRLACAASHSYSKRLVRRDRTQLSLIGCAVSIPVGGATASCVPRATCNAGSRFWLGTQSVHHGRDRYLQYTRWRTDHVHSITTAAVARVREAATRRKRSPNLHARACGVDGVSRSERRHPALPPRPRGLELTARGAVARASRSVFHHPVYRRAPKPSHRALAYRHHLLRRPRL